jgi:putative hydrolase of the HAD superfamily
VNPRSLLVTDADNTLWETDAVYAAAQLDLLRRVEENYGVSVRTGDRLQFVRELDQSLALRHPKGLRYPADLLVLAIVAASGTGDLEQATIDALQRESSDLKAGLIASAFIQQVSSVVPRLRPGVSMAVPALAECGVQIIVLTEGDLARCTLLLEQHALVRHVYASLSDNKTIESYASLRRRLGCSDAPLMIGDQIDRDIEFSQLAGYTAVHFPGGFNPSWSRDRHVIPDYVITNFEQVMPIMGCRDLSLLRRSTS